MTGLQLKDIRKSYGAVDVIHGIDLDIQQGEDLPLPRSEEGEFYAMGETLT